MKQIKNHLLTITYLWLFFSSISTYAQINIDYYKSIDGIEVTEIDGHRFIH